MGLPSVGRWVARAGSGGERVSAVAKELAPIDGPMPVAGFDASKLPELYKAAVEAMRECFLLDELKEIQNKHSAIAHYAQQAKDESLLWYAKRIQLRAYERIGELLASIEDYSERKRVAAENGISGVIANRAYDAAQIPQRVRDTMIEATPVPSLLRLAECGRGYKPGASQFGFRRYKAREDAVKVPPEACAAEFVVAAKHFAEEINEARTDKVGGSYTVAQMARAVDPDDADQYRSIVMPLMAYLGEFKMHLPKGRP